MRRNFAAKNPARYQDLEDDSSMMIWDLQVDAAYARSVTDVEAIGREF